MGQYDESTFNKSTVDRALQKVADFFIPLERLELQGKRIGSGGYGVVRLAKLKSHDLDTQSPILVAVKDLQDENGGAIPCQVACRLAREIGVWSSFRHKNILQFIGFHLSEDYKIAFLISPYAQHGNIRDYLLKTQATVEQRLGWVKDTACGLEYLHTRNPPFVHGDLKAVNVVINDQLEAALCDFGLTIAMQDGPTGLTTVTGFKGTIRWCSLEVLLDEPKTLKSDIWSWGCLVLEIMTGEYPYQDIKREQMIVFHMTQRKRKPGQVDRHSSGIRPFRLLELVKSCWDFVPYRRPSASKCLEQVNEMADPGSSLLAEDDSSLGSVPKCLEFIPAKGQITFEWRLTGLRKIFESSNDEEKGPLIASSPFGGGQWQLHFYASSGRNTSCSLFLAAIPTSDELLQGVREDHSDHRWIRSGPFSFSFEVWSLEGQIPIVARGPHEPMVREEFTSACPTWGYPQYVGRSELYWNRFAVIEQDGVKIVCSLTSRETRDLSPPIPKPFYHVLVSRLKKSL